MPLADTANANSRPAWYALSATFGRSEKAEAQLAKDSIQSYVPKQQAIVTDRKGRRQCKMIPVISNLIFVRASWDQLMAAKGGMPWLQLITRPEQERNIPIIVPDKQMDDFMRVTAHVDVIYLAPEEAEAARGRDIVIVGGPFDGVEGRLLSSRGRAKKKLLVSMPSLIAAAVEIQDFDYVLVKK